MNRVNKIYYWIAFRLHSLYHLQEYSEVAEITCAEFIKRYNETGDIRIDKYQMTSAGISVWCANRWYSFAANAGTEGQIRNIYKNSRPTYKTLIELMRIFKANYCTKEIEIQERQAEISKVKSLLNIK